MYMEGSSWNKAVQLYNPGCEPLSLENYTLAKSQNGGSPTFLSFDDDTVLAGREYTICHSELDLGVCNVSTSFLSFTGDDALGLYLANSLIDAIGVLEEDPGQAWSVGGIADATKDHTLVRRVEIAQGNIVWATSAGNTSDDSEWELAALRSVINSSLPAVHRSLLIEGIFDAGNSDLPIIDGQWMTTMIRIDGFGEVTLERVALINGLGSTGAAVSIGEGAVLVLRDCLLSGHYATEGAVLQAEHGGAQIAILASVVTNNTAANRGVLSAALLSVEGGGTQVDLSHSRIIGIEAETVMCITGYNSIRVNGSVMQNHSSWGEYGSMMAFGEGDASHVNLTVVESLLEGGWSRESGGAISLDRIEAGMVTIVGSVLSNNYAEVKGGALAVDDADDLCISIDGCVFVGNEAGESGGALFVKNSVNSVISITNSAFDLNAAGSQGGALVVDGTLKGLSGAIELANTSFTRCSATEGGAILVDYAKGLRIADGCTMSGNEALVGGALSVNGLGYLLIQQSSLSWNQARDLGEPEGTFKKGGAIYSKGDVTILDCVFEGECHFLQLNFSIGNTADGPLSQKVYGGAVSIDDGRLNVTRSTFRGSTASYRQDDKYDGVYGSALYCNGAEVLLVNCTVTGGRVNTTYTKVSELLGGAMYAKSSNLTVIGCSFTDNQLGALVAYESMVTAHDSVFASNWMPSITDLDGGAVWSITGSLEITQCRFHANWAERGNGGAVACGTGCSAVLQGNVFALNSAAVEGGAVALYAGLGGHRHELSGCNFTANWAEGGHGGAVAAGGPQQVYIAHSLLDSNVAGGMGGGVHIHNCTHIALNATTVSENRAGGNGGGLSVGHMASGGFTLSGSNISGNVADGDGGGLYVAYVADGIELDEASHVTGNAVEAGSGGGVHLEHTQLTAYGCSVIGWNAALQGGGVYAWYSSVALLGGCEIASNRVLKTGGGALLDEGSEMLVSERSLLTWNEAGEGGGAVSLMPHTSLHVDHGGRISSNQATGGSGGGIHTTTECEVTLDREAEVAGNRCLKDGGGLFIMDNSTVHIRGGSSVSANEGEYGGGLFVSRSRAVLSDGGTVTRNLARVFGGGIYATEQSEVVLTNHSTQLSFNEASYEGGGVFCGAHTHLAVLEGVLLQGDETRGRGGAVFLFNSTAVISGANMTGCSALHGGGAVAALEGSLIGLQDSYLGHNTAMAGDGGGLLLEASMGTLAAVLVERNAAALEGGGVCLRRRARAVISDSRFLLNEADTSGGAVRVANGSTLALNTSCTENNTVREGDGAGAALAAATSAVLEACRLRGGQATRGGGVFLEAGASDGAVLTRLTFEDNRGIGENVFWVCSAGAEPGDVEDDEAIAALVSCENCTWPADSALVTSTAQSFGIRQSGSPVLVGTVQGSSDNLLLPTL
eukprot:gene6341-7600_t